MDNNILEGIAQTADAASEPENGDYMKDGLLYCGKCDTPKQCKVILAGSERIVGCMCKCKEEKYKAEQLRLNAEQKIQSIQYLREIGIVDDGLLNCTFENAVPSREIEKCKVYVDKWEQLFKDNVGLLLYGEAGTGKTFAAACIANALIDKGVPAMITSLPRILNSDYDRAEILDKIRATELVVIDDLGVERSNEYALETTFLVIDERYKAKKPLIVTTNMTQEHMEKSKNNISLWRVYQRILEMCVPLEFRETRWRARVSKQKRAAVAQMFEESEQK